MEPAQLIRAQLHSPPDFNAVKKVKRLPGLPSPARRDPAQSGSPVLFYLDVPALFLIMFFSRNTGVPCSGKLLSFRCSKLAKVFAQLAGTCPVPPKRDRRGQGARYERNFLSGKPRPVGGELHMKRRTIRRDPVFLRARPVSVPKSIAPFGIGVSMVLTIKYSFVLVP